MSSIMVGLTHTEDGVPIIRAPRTLKVGIGIPKGRGIRAFIHPSGDWHIVKGEFVAGKLKETSTVFKTRSEAEAFFHAQKNDAPIVGYPRKLAYFTFSRPVITKEGGEAYEPDFDAIEATGPVPTEIKVVFMSGDPFEGAYQMWSATELKCRGDGINAMRSVSMEPNNPLAIEAKKSGLRVFPIDNGCWVRGCPYANKECKVGSSLSFQLARSVRVGGTAFFHTTGFRSTKDIFSSLEEIKTIVMMATGKSIIGIPMNLKLRPYITKPEGKPAATQYAVRVELDAVEIGKLQAKMLSQSFQAQTLQIAGTIEAVESTDDDLPMSAQAMTDEFYPEADAEDEPVKVNPAATATQTKTEDLAAKIREAKAKQSATVVTEVKTEQAAPAPKEAPSTQAPATAPAPATQAPATATAPQEAPKTTFPWSDRAGMTMSFGEQRVRLGDTEFNAVLSKHKIMMGTLKADDPKALDVFFILKGTPVDGTDTKQPGDLF